MIRNGIYTCRNSRCERYSINYKIRDHYPVPEGEGEAMYRIVPVCGTCGTDLFRLGLTLD